MVQKKTNPNEEGQPELKVAKPRKGRLAKKKMSDEEMERHTEMVLQAGAVFNMCA